MNDILMTKAVRSMAENGMKILPIVYSSPQVEW